VSEVGELARTRAREWISSQDALVMLVKEVNGRAERTDDSVRPAGPGDALAYARDIGTESPRTFRARLNDTTRCWLVTEGRRLIHASWVTSEAAWTRELRRWVRPPEGDVYIYESFTTAEARGRGAYPRALSGIASWAAQADVARLWVAVESDNAASLRAVTKAGFVVRYEVGYRRRWGRLTVDLPEGEMGDCAHTMIRASRPATGSGLPT
jgi:RimJ/RimL family protein N-acetyltransferase